jgi:hypothetical protein
MAVAEFQRGCNQVTAIAQLRCAEADLRHAAAVGDERGDGRHGVQNLPLLSAMAMTAAARRDIGPNMVPSRQMKSVADGLRRLHHQPAWLSNPPPCCRNPTLAGVRCAFHARGVAARRGMCLKYPPWLALIYFDLSGFSKNMAASPEACFCLFLSLFTGFSIISLDASIYGTTRFPSRFSR